MKLFFIFKAKVPGVIALITVSRFVVLSEKCVLNLKSGKFHIKLSFGLAQQCNREKRKPLNVQGSAATEPE